MARSMARPTDGGSGTRAALLPLPHTFRTRWPCSCIHRMYRGPDTGAGPGTGAAITQRNELVIPLHGGLPVTVPETLAVRDQVHRAVQRIIERGRTDGTISQNVTPRDIVAFGAMLAQPRQPDTASGVAARESRHPQCGGELCALARVNMSGSREPSRSPDDDCPRAVVTSPSAAQGSCKWTAGPACVDRRRSASRLGAESTSPLPGTFLAPGRGTVLHAAVATVARHSRGEVCGSTRPAPDGHSPYRPAEATTRPPPR